MEYIAGAWSVAFTRASDSWTAAGKGTPLPLEASHEPGELQPEISAVEKPSSGNNAGCPLLAGGGAPSARGGKGDAGLPGAFGPGCIEGMSAQTAWLAKLNAKGTAR